MSLNTTSLGVTPYFIGNSQPIVSLLLHHVMHFKVDVVRRLLLNLEINHCLIVTDDDSFEELRSSSCETVTPKDFDMEIVLELQSDLVIYAAEIDLEMMSDILEDSNLICLLDEYQAASVDALVTNWPDTNIIWVDFPEVLPKLSVFQIRFNMSPTQADRYLMARSDELDVNPEDTTLLRSRKHLNTQLGEESLKERLEHLEKIQTLTGIASSHHGATLRLVPKLEDLSTTVTGDTLRHLIYATSASKALISEMVTRLELFSLQTVISHDVKSCLLIDESQLEQLHSTRPRLDHVHFFEVPSLEEYVALLSSLSSVPQLRISFYIAESENFKTFDAGRFEVLWSALLQTRNRWRGLLSSVDRLILNDDPEVRQVGSEL